MRNAEWEYKRDHRTITVAETAQIKILIHFSCTQVNIHIGVLVPGHFELTHRKWQENGTKV